MSCSSGGTTGAWPGEDGGTSAPSGAGSSGGGTGSTGSTGDDAGSGFAFSDAGSVVDDASFGAIDAAGLQSGSDAGACAIGTAGIGGLIPGPTMAPGTTCIACHAATGAGALDIAGTVYTNLDEANLCLGVASSLQVVITDAQGTAHTLAVNSSGNFYDSTLGGIPTPYTAKVVGPNGSVPMMTSQTSGDCNSCHTSAGTQGAAGRIVGP